MFEITRIAQLLGHTAAIYALAPFRQPSQFLSAAGDGWIVAWDLEHLPDGKLIAKVEDNIFALHYMTENDTVIVGTMNGYVIWINLADNSILHKSLAHSKGVFAIYQVGLQIYTAGADGKLIWWDSKKYIKKESLQLAYQSLRNIKHDDNILYIGSTDGNIYTVDLKTFTSTMPIINAHESSVFALYIDKEACLWTGGKDAHLKIWQLADKKLLSSQPAHLFTVNSICELEHLNIIATASRDKTVKLWDKSTKKLLKVMDTMRHQMHMRSINALWYNVHYQVLVTASDDRSLMLWQINKS